ncbi:hypothetical protein PGB28_09395 [Primorskyibacter aestuariivivens]|uniref:hypothetical protein n=1 Tax=Primorskyibacter aestuariivivens TaxID=1888912 RepID=UPI002300C8F7|nr:hypothetical protein [Primorskyibacter aestuariivivens]MDA7428673.1 hypothetical protein [Primorskyibacter aestuariivivens]
MAGDTKIAHAANVLVCGGGLLAADTVTGGAASMIGGMLSWKEVSRKRSDGLVTLQAHIADRLRALTRNTDANDSRYHLPDMISFAAPTPADVMSRNAMQRL